MPPLLLLLLLPLCVPVCHSCVCVQVCAGAVFYPELSLCRFTLSTNRAVGCAFLVPVRGLVLPGTQHVQAAGLVNKKATWTSTEQFGAALAVIVYNDAAASMACLLEIQRFFADIGFPKGVLEATFHHLFDADVLSQDAFVAWKDRVDDTSAKGTALIQLARCVDSFGSDRPHTRMHAYHTHAHIRHTYHTPIHTHAHIYSSSSRGIVGGGAMWKGVTSLLAHCSSACVQVV